MSSSNCDNNSKKYIQLPTYYSLKSGPDLNRISQFTGLSFNEIITIHSQNQYQVCAIGFAPGFAFLASVDESIATPRHSQPRTKVPAGSIGIANKQTAVYPNDSSGGWNIIGNCPLPLYDPNNTTITPFEVGDIVFIQSYFSK